MGDSSAKLKPCEFLGTLCSDDCTGLLLCTTIGENPIELKKCNVEVDGFAYCKNVNVTVATCSGEEQNCNVNNDAKGIMCGSFGEYPHPQLCDVTVRCVGPNQPPKELCYCPFGYYVNMNFLNLPCHDEDDLCRFRKPVNCTYAGQNGFYPGSNRFCYGCGDGNNTDIYLYFCGSPRTSELKWFNTADIVDSKVGKTCIQTSSPKQSQRK